MSKWESYCAIYSEQVVILLGPVAWKMFHEKLWRRIFNQECTTILEDNRRPNAETFFMTTRHPPNCHQNGIVNQHHPPSSKPLLFSRRYASSKENMFIVQVSKSEQK